MEELEQEIKRVELLYSKLEKTENGTNDDWYYSGMLKGLREALRLVKKLTINGFVSSYLIKFNEVDAEGNMHLPNSINIESLNNLKVSGQIKDFEIDENGVKVIKDFRLESGSL
jgi:hypothetical protein